MTTPTGLLMWSQPSTYDAVDDRLVITALAGGATGVVQAVTMTAGTGLTVNLSPWLALASCDDGTLAVAGDQQTSAITETAGGGTARTDLLWCDTAPDTGAWTLSLISAAQATGRSGVLLGQITVPANASLASQMTFTPSRQTAAASSTVLAHGLGGTPSIGAASGSRVTLATASFTLAQPRLAYAVAHVSFSYTSSFSGTVTPFVVDIAVSGPTSYDWSGTICTGFNTHVEQYITTTVASLAAGNYTVTLTGQNTWGGAGQGHDSVVEMWDAQWAAEAIPSV